MLQSYSKQEITQQILCTLHLLVEVYASSSSVILQATHKLSEHPNTQIPNNESMNLRAGLLMKFNKKNEE